MPRNRIHFRKAQAETREKLVIELQVYSVSQFAMAKDE